ncbi:MAG: hypothetical protein ACREH9_06840, partial [Pseudomonadota bacterium]
TDLFNLLQSIHHQSDWPKDSAALSRLLNREAETLQASGIEITQKRAAGGKHRHLTIAKSPH